MCFSPAANSWIRKAGECQGRAEILLLFLVLLQKIPQEIKGARLDFPRIPFGAGSAKNLGFDFKESTPERGMDLSIGIVSLWEVFSFHSPDHPTP